MEDALRVARLYENVYLRRSVSASVVDEIEMSNSNAAINKTGILFTTGS
jgi:hypothetical protein